MTEQLGPLEEFRIRADIFDELNTRSRGFTDFERLLERNVRPKKILTDFDVLLQKRPVSDFERLMRGSYVPPDQKTAARIATKANLLRAFLGGLKIVGNVALVVGFEQEFIKALKEREDFESLAEAQAHNERLLKEIQRRNKEARIQRIELRGTPSGVGPPVERAGREAPPQKVPKIRPSTKVAPVPPGGGPPLPSGIEFRIPEPTLPTPPKATRPARLDDPGDEPKRVDVKLPELATPGFGSPLPKAKVPKRSPLRSPFTAPLFSTFPQFRLRTSPLEFEPRSRLTRVEEPKVSSKPEPRTMPEMLQRFPQQECKPKPPTKRRKCWKGLYKEGPMSNQLRKTRWTEIDCATGRELGKTRRKI